MLSVLRSLVLVLCGMGMCIETFATQPSLGVQQDQVEEMLVDDLFGDDGLSLEEIDLDNLRSFEDSLEPVQISFKEKMEMLFLLLTSKTRSYRGGVLAHFKDHCNEYLLGSACIGTILLVALLKKYTTHLCATADGK